MEGFKMNNYTSSDFTSIQIDNTPDLTIHVDGSVTTNEKLKPDEAATLVLNSFKQQWLADAQAIKIRELQDYIVELEAWKAQQLAIEASWNPQKVANLLNIPIGTEIHPNILPAIEKLHERINQLKNILISIT
jgi:hypothetical protein